MSRKSKSTETNSRLVEDQGGVGRKWGAVLMGMGLLGGAKNVLKLYSSVSILETTALCTLKG